jgi:hypothetical protein
MAENKVVNTTQLDADLTTIANAIREKTGESDSLVFPVGFISAMDNLALSNNLYFFLDEKFTLVNGIPIKSSGVVFTSDKLKSLPDYHALIIEKITDTSISNHIFLILEMKFGYRNLKGKFIQGSSDCISGSGITIDNGSITIATGTTNQMTSGEYHLYIICNKGE